MLPPNESAAVERLREPEIHSECPVKVGMETRDFVVGEHRCLIIRGELGQEYGWQENMNEIFVSSFHPDSFPSTGSSSNFPFGVGPSDRITSVELGRRGGTTSQPPSDVPDEWLDNLNDLSHLQELNIRHYTAN